MNSDEGRGFSGLVFFFFVGKGVGVLPGLLPKDCSPQKFSKKFFRVGVWGGFEWVGGIGNSGFVVGTVLGVILMYLHILYDVKM